MHLYIKIIIIVQQESIYLNDVKIKNSPHFFNHNASTRSTIYLLTHM